MDQVTVCVGTYGDREHWLKLAERAIASASPQAPVIHVHGATLAAARNGALEQVQTPLVCFLDADDELSPGYCDAMAGGAADIRVPSISYIRADARARAPYVPKVPGHTHDCHGGCLVDGNFACIGTTLRTSLLRSVGGFEEFGMYEDWAAIARCHKAGGTLETLPAAVYRAWVREDSRNRAPDRATRERWHWEIHRAVWPELHQEEAAA